MTINNFQVSRDASAKLIIDADPSISLGVHPAYLEFVRTFYPQYKNISRNTTRSDIMAYYSRWREASMKEISKGTFYVALAFDVWSKCAMEDTSVVIYFVDD